MRGTTLLLITGLLALAAGVVALIYPLAASVAVSLLIGWSFAVLGALLLLAGLTAPGWRVVQIILGVLMMLLGVSLLADPLEGVVGLTIVLGVLLAISGVVKLLMSWSALSGPFRASLLLSGALSLLLGIMILTNTPGSGVIAIGVLLAIELLSNGIWAISLALMMRRGTRF
ncbi:DUF308 domain-containing protein [Thalassovita taeanensis]|uniref:Uncharacterized membrane protein HdeD, DUF308 family n=1 Tax=Thalassovita taeanensis TaxID=657014 RepID=A0A1H9DGF7_9RHOB|nr:DUF308 domain-containing protein [Thalassovita taeanensis]SEQ11808.1 Uncharacterized membrane protein HdeD, DUF308 family [Thalassovita taeanensis]